MLKENRTDKLWRNFQKTEAEIPIDFVHRKFHRIWLGISTFKSGYLPDYSSKCPLIDPGAADAR